MNGLRPLGRAAAVKWLAVFAVNLFFTIASRGVLSEITWHDPPDKVVVSGGGMLHVVLEVQEEDPEDLKIYLNDLPVLTESKPVPAEEAIFLHYVVQLEAGSNTLEVSWEGGHERRVVFYKIAWGPAAKEPPGYTQLVFHVVEGHEKNCTGCHDLQSVPEDEQPSSPPQSTCYSCHSGIVAFTSVHRPASEWTCTYCHDADSTPVKYVTPQPMVSKLCFSCHAALKEYFDAGPYRHGPVTTGRCTICHNPHASNNPFQLVRSAWYLCTSCHTRNASGRHIIAWGPTGDTHPTRGKPDPVRPHRQLTCVSCHNPHAAPSPNLWQFESMSYVQLCITCHEM